MSNRTWKWFKNGWQFDIIFKSTSPSGDIGVASIPVFCETKDKQDARLNGLIQLQKYGYKNIEITKIIPRF